MFISGSLRPVYLIQSTESQSTNISSDSQPNNKTHKQTNTEHLTELKHYRGRSFSPPKRPKESYHDQTRFVQTEETRQTNFYRNSRFHKSFSSDQLVPENTRQSNSLSSGSSSTTSGECDLLFSLRFFLSLCIVFKYFCLCYLFHVNDIKVLRKEGLYIFLINNRNKNEKKSSARSVLDMEN